MQAATSPFPSFLLSPLAFLCNFHGELSSSCIIEGFLGFKVRVLFSTYLLFIPGVGAMKLSKIHKKLFISVSARLLPSASARREVPARAAAAAAVAGALASLPPDQRLSLPSSSEELSSMYGSWPQGPSIEEPEEEFYEEDFEQVVYTLVKIPAEEGMECFEIRQLFDWLNWIRFLHVYDTMSWSIMKKW